MAAVLIGLGMSVDEVDIVNVHLPDQDIADDAVWGRIRQRLEAGTYIFVFAGPPCRTFSESRGLGPGPPVLRDWDHIYGFPKSQGACRGLRQHHFEQLRTDNLLAERVAEACSIVKPQGGGYGVEQPLPWKGSVSMFQLASFMELRRAGACFVVFDQCMFGAPSKKPSMVLYDGIDFSALARECNHAATLQQSSTGQEYLALAAVD